MPRDADDPAHTTGDWRTMHLWQFQPVRDVLLALSVFGLLWLGHELATVTVPMLLALLLAYLVEPLVRWSTSRFTWVSRPVAAGTLIVLIGLAVVGPVAAGLTFGAAQGIGAIDRFTQNVGDLTDAIDAPEDDELRESLPNEGWRLLRDYLVGLEVTVNSDAADQDENNGASVAEGANADDEPDSAEAEPALELTTSQLIGRRVVGGLQAWLDSNMSQLGDGALSVGAWLLGAAASFVMGLFSFGFGLFLTMFFFFFFSSGLGGVKRFFEKLVPKQHRRQVFDLAGKMDAVIAAFIRGRLTIMAIMSVEFVLLYWVIGTPAPLLVGIAVGVLSAVPYLSLIGIPVSIGLMMLDPPSAFAWQSEWWWLLGAPIAVYMIVQATDDYIWTPVIQGKATDMDTPTILFAVLAGGVLAGIYGVLIAIPVAACLKILIREVFWPKFLEWVDGRAKDPLPLDRG